jgi:DNA-binding MarR family transcriptional regulator
MELTGALLTDAARKWKEGVSKAVEPVGLTTNAYLLLDAFARIQLEEGFASSQAAAARLAKLDVNLAAQAVKFLLSHHLVNRVPNKQDSRSYVLTLTLAGAQLLQRAHLAVSTFEKGFFVHLQKVHFTEALSTLTK